MTSRDITERLARFHWSPIKHIVVPNCCGFPMGEADLLILYPSGWMDEVEIKISKADFKRDFTKKADKHAHMVRGRPEVEHNYNKLTRSYERSENWDKVTATVIRRFWFAMPIALANELITDIPSYAGLLAVYANGRVSELKKAPNLKPARKLTDEERLRLLKSTYHRYWDLRRKVGTR